MIALLLTIVAMIFAFQAIRARALIPSALWLAGVSALTAMLLYLLGAHQVAVIELSVGTGLVTVLFVLAINIAGDDPLDPHPVVPRLLAVGVCLLSVLVLGWFVFSEVPFGTAASPNATVFADVFWQQRGLDVMVQVVLIFSGVLGFLGLLSESKAPLEGSLAEAVISGRDRELQALEEQLLEKQESPE
jgi:uncharacterized MnhB-related membrane protein